MAAEKRPILNALAQALKPYLEAHGIVTSADRLVTLRSAQTLLSDLAGPSEPLAAVVTFAGAELSTSEAAVSRCLGSAADVRDAVGAAAWDIINMAVGLIDRRREAAEGLRTRLTNALQADEHVVSLKTELRDIQGRASRLLAESGSPGTPPPGANQPSSPSNDPAPSAGPTAVSPGEEVLDEHLSSTVDASEASELLETLRARVSETPDARLTIQWRLTRRRDGGGA
jgi:hypothetical protein